MRRVHRKIAHYGAPAAFLLAVTIFVLILHGGLAGHSSKPSSHPATTTMSTSSSTRTTETVATQMYTIRYGDTLGAVAIHFGVTVEDILALNPGIEPTALRVGQKIKIGKAPTLR
jgi:LysM repeat protein